jgi:predicted nucleic acid-binding protein
VVLVDTSVWIDHLNRSDPTLASLLERAEVAVHPMVIGELALGSIPARSVVIELLSNLPSTDVALSNEVMTLVESRSLFGRGLSLVDAHLLASTAITLGATLWTRDKKLAQAAHDLGIAHGRVGG